jgi:hypothetical protein
MKWEQVEKSLAVIADAVPTEAALVGQYIRGVRAKDVAVIGESDCLALRTKSGVVRAFKSEVVLTVQNAGLISMPGRIGTIRSFEGYKALANAIGLVVMNASTVMVDGTPHPNPHIVRTPEGRILSVSARALAFGYTSRGVPAVSDRTAVFDLATYRVVDLLAKAKRDKLNFRLLPAGDEAPDDMPGAAWTAYPIDERATLWANLAFEEMPDYLAQIVNRDRKAAEFAQTFAQRNALKHHPAMPLGRRGDSAEEVVAVVSWRPVKGPLMQWHESEYFDLVGAVEDMTGTPRLVTGRDVITADEEAGVAGVEAQGEDEVEAAQMSPAEALLAKAKELDELFSAEEPDAEISECPDEEPRAEEPEEPRDPVPVPPPKEEPIDPDTKQGQSLTDMEAETMFEGVMAWKEKNATAFRAMLEAVGCAESDIDPLFGDAGILVKADRFLRERAKRKKGARKKAKGSGKKS